MKRPISGLYLIVDPAACRGRDPVWLAERAIDGGASVIQWRDKGPKPGAQLGAARRIRALCRERGVLFIANDDPQLAVDLEADGVHLGQKDMPIGQARPIVGPDAIIGVSTNNVREALAAQHAGADYIAVGSIFTTSTKRDIRPANLDRLREIETAVHVPVVAIGGINASNIAGVVDAGARAAAVISAVCAADDPGAAALQLSEAFLIAPRFGRH
jgi:thiamine-phosphate diphosphorylase